MKASELKTATTEKLIAGIGGLDALTELRRVLPSMTDDELKGRANTSGRQSSVLLRDKPIYVLTPDLGRDHVAALSNSR